MTAPARYDRVVGIDPSLTALGLASAYRDGTIITDTIRVKGDGCARLDRIRAAVRQHVTTRSLVVIEGPAHGSATSMRQSGHHERGGLWWLLAWTFWKDGIPYAVCPPSTRAKWATGKGNANKDAVLLACERRLPHAQVANNNEADAAVLAAMGAHALGWLPDQPQYSREALLKVQWPDNDITAQLLQPYEQLVPVETS